ISTSYFPSSAIPGDAAFLAELAQPSMNSARLFFRGKPYLSAYHAPGHFQDLLNRLKSVYGIDAYAEPQMFPRLFGSDANSKRWDSGGITGMSASNYAVMMGHPAWSKVQGFAAFEIAKSINGQADAISTLWDSARSRGKTARVSIVPYYKGLAHKGNWMVYEGWGFARLRASWKRAIDSGVPAAEIITLNDFAESSYINSWKKDDPVILTDHWNKGDVPALLDHSGFRYFSKRYVQWFKTGREPAITKDELYYAYRLHPRDATSYHYLSSQEKAALQKYLPSGVNADWMYRKDGLPESFKGWGPNWSMGIDWRKFSDGIHVAVRLSAPADVYINGAKVGSNLPAGEHLLVKPGSRYDGESGLGYPLHTFTRADFGRPAFEIRRNGRTVMKHQGELEITAYPVPGCWNIFARKAPGSGDTPPSGGTPTPSPSPSPSPEPEPEPAPVPTTPAPGEPARLYSRDVAATATGSTSYNASAGRYDIRATGADIWGSSDQFRFVENALTGDAELVVRVRSLTAADAWTKAGLMFRASHAANAAHVSLFATPGNGVRMQWRTSTGGSSSTSGGNGAKAPQWLKLTRAGSAFSAFRSTNGATWELVNRVAISMPSTLRAGLAVTSHHKSASTLASFDNYRVKSASNTTPAPAPGTPEPAPTPSNPGGLALFSSDIGAPAISGSTSLGNGVYTLRAGGTDIWGRSDQFRFARATVSGDADLTVRVKSVTHTDHWAKTGLMFRASLDADSAFVGVYLSPGAGLTMQWRNTSGGNANGTAAIRSSAPRWLRLARRGNTFTGYHSADGSSWVKITSVAIGLPSAAQAGLALTSHNRSTAATAVLDNFSLKTKGGAGSTPPPSSTPSSPAAPKTPALRHSDIGAPGLTGSYSVNGDTGAHTLRASGNDIWNVSDQFHFARTDINGDAEITARLSSLARTDPWAKAGMMFRSGSQGNAPFVAVLVTPDNGVVMHWRKSAGAVVGSSRAFPGRAPQWVRLMRDGNRFYAFASANGQDWDLVDFVDVNLPATALGGLVACAHDTRAHTTAVFDQVTID
ncbi:MAG: endo-1,3-alpha-glucanase family glycosylhydrolase, partial [Opitutaceae bacterium]